MGRENFYLEGLKKSVAGKLRVERTKKLVILEAALEGATKVF